MAGTGSDVRLHGGYLTIRQSETDAVILVSHAPTISGVCARAKEVSVTKQPVRTCDRSDQRRPYFF